MGPLAFETVPVATRIRRRVALRVIVLAICYLVQSYSSRLPQSQMSSAVDSRNQELTQTGIPAGVQLVARASVLPSYTILKKLH